MKYYGAKKATEFNKGQIGNIYRLAKTGDLRLEKWMASRLYNLADYYGYDDNGSVERDDEPKILAIIAAVSENDIEKAQNLIDQYTNGTWELLGRKTKENANRNLVH